MSRLLRHLRRFGRETGGVAAVEMSLVTGVFALAMFNAVEVGRYAYVLMEVGQATQAGAEAAFVTCDTNHLPATENCPNLNSAVTTAVQSTSLGAHVTLNGAITEGYYCLNASNALVYASDVTSKPSDCSAYGQAALSPVLYLQVHTTYSYSPIFTTFTIGSSLPGSIQKTSWMRME